MKKYFIYLNGTQSEPLSMEELKELSIDKNTLVWYKGLTNWEKAGKLDELNELWQSLDETQDTDYEEPQNYANYWFGGIAVVVTLLLFGGFYYYKNSKITKISIDSLLNGTQINNTLGLTDKIIDSTDLTDTATSIKVAVAEKFENYLPKIKESHLDYEFVDYSIETNDFNNDNLIDAILMFRLHSKTNHKEILTGIAIYENKGFDRNGKPQMMVSAGKELNVFLNLRQVADNQAIFDVLDFESNDSECCPTVRNSELLVTYSARQLLIQKNENSKIIEQNNNSASISTIEEDDFNVPDVENDEIKPETVNNSPQYIAISSHQIIDTKTNLEWYIGEDKNYTWEEAYEFVKELKEKDNAWRMPKSHELMTLYDESSTAGVGFVYKGKRYPAKIHNSFSKIGSGSWVWVNKVYLANNSLAKAINFNQGVETEINSNNNEYSVRVFAVKHHGK